MQQEALILEEETTKKRDQYEPYTNVLFNAFKTDHPKDKGMTGNE